MRDVSVLGMCLILTRINIKILVVILYLFSKMFSLGRKWERAHDKSLFSGQHVKL